LIGVDDYAKTKEIVPFHESTIGFRGEADLLLVLKVESKAEWRELHFGC